MRYCSKCGNKLRDDQLYCPKCGNKEPLLKDTKKSSWKSFDAKDKKTQNVNWDFSSQPTTTKSEAKLPYKGWRLGLSISIAVLSLLYLSIFIIGFTVIDDDKIPLNIQQAVFALFCVSQTIAIADIVQSIVMVILLKKKKNVNTTFTQNFAATIILLAMSLIFAFVQYYIISITVPATIMASCFMCFAACIISFTTGKQIKVKKTAR